MSLLHAIIAQIRERGQASADTISIPGVVRQQINKAFQNAVTRKQIKAIARRHDRFGHAKPSVYALWDDPRPAVTKYRAKPRPKAQPKQKPQPQAVPPVSSVFEMGDRVARGQPCWTAREPRKDFERAEA